LSIGFLEENYQVFVRRRRAVARLKEIAGRYTVLQARMRALLSEVTGVVCAECGSKCCLCFPVEGWFGMPDYFIFRLRFPKPSLPDDVEEEMTKGCSFLTRQGCALAGDRRPFACTMYDCKRVYDSLRRGGNYRAYAEFKEALRRVHHEASSIARSALETADA
jgi:hypothetical protein